MSPLVDLPEAVWDEVLEVNLRGPLLLCQRVAPLMTSAGRGSIMNMSSVGGTREGLAPG